MHVFRQRLFSHLRFRAAAYLVLLVALIPTGIAYWRVQHNVHTRDESRFKAIVEKTSETIRDHLEMLTADLVAVTGFLEANTDVTRAEWNVFIDKLELDRRHPGIRSVGFAEKVNVANLAAFTKRMRKEEADFEVRPTPEFPLSFPTVHVVQYATNVSKRAGWDSYSVPGRRVAIDDVMRTGRPAVTGKMQYGDRDEPGSGGFAVFVPVGGKNPEAGPANSRGVVFSSFIPQNFFDALAKKRFDGSVSIELFDGGKPEQSSLMASFGTGERLKPASFRDKSEVRLLNHEFLVRVSTLPAFENFSEQQMPRVVLCGGLGFSFLVFFIAWRQGSARSAAEKLNSRLRESKEQLRAANAELERNISEARRTEDLLAHERDLLSMLLDHSPDAVYFKDRESRFLKCGRAVHGHLGLQGGADAVGKTDFDFFTEEHARPAFELEQEIVRTGQPVIGLVEKETWHDGRETWVLTSKMPLRDNHGNIIGTFGISKDITKLKAIELALEKEKDLLAVTLRSIGDGVITTDLYGRIVLFNEVAERLTGWKYSEAAGQRLKTVFCTNSPETNTEMLHRALDESVRRPAHDATLTARDGSVRNISQSLAPIIDRDGQNIGAVLVFRDITEKLKTEAELLKASKLESIGALAGGIAHDFNNVLTVILGNISLARLAESMGQPTGDSLVEAEKASIRARELTQRLLTFARGGAPIKKAFDLAPLVRECAERALEGSKVAPEFFISDALWLVEADESQISQVMHNLISYTRASIGEDPRLDIHVLNHEIADDPLLLFKPGRYVRVSIRDYGAGIQPENLTKIFEPYFGLKKHGSGLELATAYSIVRKHEGQIRVESIAGQGTVFHVYLPAVAAVLLPTPATKTISSRAKSPLPRRVLVMDDELPIRKLAVLLLQRLGCTVVAAADGGEAIELYESARLRGEPFDAVIMDLTVPHGMGGKETIRQLKALDPEVRAIVSSGYSNDPVMANFRDYGFAGVVPKPYSTEDLAAALEDLSSAAPEVKLQ